MSKLHEVLAVEKDLQGQAAKIILETEKLFKGGTAFNGSITAFVPFAESEGNLAEESREEVVTTVPDRLTYTAEHVARWLDAVIQKETTNQVAKADLIVEDDNGRPVVLASSVPATMLLGLEAKLTAVRSAIAGMPTLDAKRAWIPDPTGKKNIFRTEQAETVIRTKKVTEPLVLTQPLIKDGVGIPAQVQIVSKDVPTGKVTKTLFSGAVTSARAATFLARLDRLIRAVKQARQRANQVEVTGEKIGAALFEFILA